jgi:hypothetical protein
MTCRDTTLRHYVFILWTSYKEGIETVLFLLQNMEMVYKLDPNKCKQQIFFIMTKTIFYIIQNVYNFSPTFGSFYLQFLSTSIKFIVLH